MIRVFVRYDVIERYELPHGLGCPTYEEALRYVDKNKLKPVKKEIRDREVSNISVDIREEV